MQHQPEMFAYIQEQHRLGDDSPSVASSPAPIPAPPPPVTNSSNMSGDNQIAIDNRKKMQQQNMGDISLLGASQTTSQPSILGA